MTACAFAAAAPLIVDQSNTIQPHFGLSIGIGTLGEEFIPEFSGVDTVTLQMSDVSGTTGTAAVYIRAGLHGPILGTSEPVNVPLSPDDHSFESFDFIFPRTVNLSPGSSYVLAVRNLTPEMANLFLWGNMLPNNTGGHATAAGSPYPCCDFYFLEGLGQASTIPEPLSWLLTGGGVLAIVAVRWRMYEERPCSPKDTRG